MAATELQKCEQQIKKNKIEVIDLKAIDLTGRLHHISLPVYDDTLKKIIKEGVGFDGSSYGFKKVENSDMILVPDLNTAKIDPFREAPTLSFFSHIILTDDKRSPFTQDGRYLAKKAEAYLKKITGADKGKLIPFDIAMLVNDFLVEHFPRIMDYQFTAHIEEELDEVARGEMDYHKMLDEFYFPFHDKVEHTIEHTDRVSGERILGKDPKTGKQVSVRMARFGPVAQLTNTDDEEEKPQYAGLRREQKLEYITLEEALELFKLPRLLGDYEESEVTVAIGRFGPYVKHNNKFSSLNKEYDPYSIELDEAIEVIEAKRKADAEKMIKVFDENPDYQILNGRWGPYLKAGKKNIRLPKDREPDSFTLEECIELAENPPEPKRKGRSKKK